MIPVNLISSCSPNRVVAAVVMRGGVEGNVSAFPGPFQFCPQHHLPAPPLEGDPSSSCCGEEGTGCGSPFFSGLEGAGAGKEPGENQSGVLGDCPGPFL